MAPAAALPSLCLLIGAVLGCQTAIHPWPIASLVPLGWLIAVIGWWTRRSFVAVAAISLGMLAAGTTLAADARDRALHPSARARLDSVIGHFLMESVDPAPRQDPIPSRLRLDEDATARDGFVAVRADLTEMWLDHAWQPVEGGVLVTIGGSVAESKRLDWRAGRTIEAPMTFRRPARYLDAGVADFERDRALQGVTLLSTVKSGLLVRVIAKGSVLSELAARVRAHVRRAVTAWIEPHGATSAAIALAVLIGDRTALTADTREKLQAAGTYHVTAISGGNIAILATTATLALLVVGVRGRYAALAAIAVLALYALVITSGPSVWRATVMAISFFTARAMDHRTDVWQTTAVAAAAMAIGAPLDVLDPGFILTFGATVALIEGARMGSSASRHRLLAWVRASVVASAAVEIALLPVSARLFFRVTGAGLVLNLLAVPLMGVVQLATLVVALASGLPVVATPAGWLAHLGSVGLTSSADLVRLAPWSTARVPPPHLLTITAYYGALVAARIVRRPMWRGMAVAALVVTGASIVSGFDPSNRHAAPAHGTVRLTMFDVGQGEAVLLQTPSGGDWLIDAGGAPFGGSDIGSRVLAPALWARGVRRLDTLLITHGDPDHMGGALDVLRDFSPKRLSVGITVPTHEATRELYDEAHRLGIPLDARRAGQVEQVGPLRVRVLHPPPPEWERRRVRNDDSVVVEVVFGDVAILLTGDIGADVERAIVPQLSRTRVRVLKVAHHGSRTSSSRELIESWRPHLALISVGRGNTFGHPATEVVERLRSVGATVLRTDRQGEIMLESDGRTVWWRVFQ